MLGVTGSIAAYKAAYLLRLLVKEGASVQVIMTPSAKAFIGEVTLAALSSNPVLSDFFESQGGDWNSHVDLGVNADLMLVAPVTATTLGKMAHGIADNLLVATYLSARCPVVLAPTMDMDMYAHPATRQNIQVLRSTGAHVIDPDEGELASGLEGKGRMPEPEMILQFIRTLDSVSSKKKLLNKRVLVTAGPTHEKIDPVRFISNYASGKMGYAIAEAFAEEGASVILVSGPVAEQIRHRNIDLVPVSSAQEMFEACQKVIDGVDVAVFNAAVADYTPAAPSAQKLKRKDGEWTLHLKPTLDIASEMGAGKKKEQFFVGFALESEKGTEEARNKLEKKNMDLIVLNSLKDEGAGFGTETNKVTMIDRTGSVEEYELKPKRQVASDLVSRVIKSTGYA
ncbi:MAG: bifunctional phosphopantothenoylcysteine decarboxylase/phosphopantothenate--cysteine ligase CoaBC [Bacteroidales bacterium]